MRFVGKIGFVTGGGTGIGLACARAVVAGGGRVMLAGRREEVVRASATPLGPNAAWVRCDVTDDASVDAAVARTVEQFGGLHVAVKADGQGSIGSVLNASTAEFAQTLDTNLTGVSAPCVPRRARCKVTPAASSTSAQLTAHSRTGG